MAPTKRIDETGDDDGVESADLRVPDCANPFRVSDGAAHSRSACESLTGLSGCRKNIEQGAAFSDMGYGEIRPTSQPRRANGNQRRPRLTRLPLCSPLTRCGQSPS